MKKYLVFLFVLLFFWLTFWAFYKANWSLLDMIAKRMWFTSDWTASWTSVMDINSWWDVIVYGSLKNWSGSLFVPWSSVSTWAAWWTSDVLIMSQNAVSWYVNSRWFVTSTSWITWWLAGRVALFSWVNDLKYWLLYYTTTSVWVWVSPSNLLELSWANWFIKVWGNAWASAWIQIADFWTTQAIIAKEWSAWTLIAWSIANDLLFRTNAWLNILFSSNWWVTAQLKIDSTWNVYVNWDFVTMSWAKLWKDPSTCTWVVLWTMMYSGDNFYWCRAASWRVLLN